jgi:hypothetical protein
MNGNGEIKLILTQAGNLETVLCQGQVQVIAKIRMNPLGSLFCSSRMSGGSTVQWRIMKPQCAKEEPKIVIIIAVIASQPPNAETQWSQILLP